MIPEARVAAVLFTTPKKFMSEVWKKAVSNEDGLVDRFLLTYMESQPVKVTDSMAACVLLKEFYLVMTEYYFRTTFELSQIQRSSLNTVHMALVNLDMLI